MIDQIEVVNGFIVGGENYIYWQLFYDNKPQTNQLTADTEQEAIQEAKTCMNELKQLDPWLYRENKKWEVRTF